MAWWKIRNSLVALCLLLVSLATPVPQASAASSVQVHFIDVGQGDSILVRTDQGNSALIDGGSEGTGALQYLQTQGVDQLDTLVATHPHEDHIGGLIGVLQSVPVRQVISNGQVHTTRSYERFLDAIAFSRTPYREVKRGESFAVGELSFEVLNPVANTGRNLNNQSVVLRMVHGEVAFLFTLGDAEKKAEQSMLSSGRTLRANVVKVGHHGSRSSSSPAFLDKVKPEVAVYSAGAGNSYGHPHSETIAALTRLRADIYGTDINGTVVVTSSGSGYSVATSKGNNPRAPPVPTTPDLAASEEPTAPDDPEEPVLPDDPEEVQQPEPPAEEVVGEEPPAVAPEPAPAALAIEIVSVTSPVRRGGRATLVAKTSPGANATITVYYKSGPSTAQGLGPKVADANGNVSWTWMVGTRTTPGTWRIVVTASLDEVRVTNSTTFVVG